MNEAPADEAQMTAATADGPENAPNDEFINALADALDDVPADETADVHADEPAHALDDETDDALDDETDDALADELADVLVDALADEIADETDDALADELADVLVDALADEIADEIADETDEWEESSEPERPQDDDENGLALTSPEGSREEDLGALTSILESLLFASEKPLHLAQIKKLLGERSTAKVKRAMKALTLSRQESGVVIVEVDGGYQLRTNPTNARWVRRLEEVKPVRMSRAALEVLAVVAYRQPVTRVEIDQIRGVDSGPVLKQLLQRDLLRIIGRKDEVGKPFLYGSTREFLSFFGLSSLGDLPSLRDVAELAREEVRPTAPGAFSDAPKEETAEEETAEEELREVEPDEIAPDDQDVDELDEGDEEVLGALADASEAARGADRVKRSLRKMAAAQGEDVAPDSEAGRMLSSLQEVVAVQRKRRPTLDGAHDGDENEAKDDDESAAQDGAVDSAGKRRVRDQARLAAEASQLREEERLLGELDDLLEDREGETPFSSPRQVPPSAPFSATNADDADDAMDAMDAMDAKDAKDATSLPETEKDLDNLERDL